MPTLYAGIDVRTKRSRPVNLSDRQMHTLGFLPKEKPHKIGCGAWACAYLPKSTGTVVKVTADPRDARVSYYLMHLPGGCPIWAIPIRAVYRLSADKFVIASEKAEKLPEDWAEGIDTIYDYTERIDLRAHQWPKLHDYILAEIVRDEILNTEESRERTQLMRKCLSVINDAIRQFAKIGWDWADHHSGNFGWYTADRDVMQPRPVIIDFGGLSGFKPGQRPTISDVGRVSLPEIGEIPILPF